MNDAHIALGLGGLGFATFSFFVGYMLGAISEAKKSAAEWKAFNARNGH
jgi:hypothetical protein